MRRAGLGALLALFMVGSAQAAYAPVVTITVPAGGGPGGPAAVSATITQASGENPTREIEARLPGTFGFNSAFSAPAGAQIGRVEATSPFGSATGRVLLTADFRLQVVIEAYGGLFTFEANGVLDVLPGQEIVVRFTNLPPIPLTRVALIMDGGASTPLALPRDCGTHVIKSTLTSALDEVVSSEHPIDVRGCRDLPQLGRVRADGRVVRWTTSELVEVRLLRWAGRKWHSLGTRMRQGGKVRIGARWRGTRVRRGRYRVDLVAIDGTGRRSSVRSVELRVP